jgi:hypothetical protein
VKEINQSSVNFISYKRTDYLKYLKNVGKMSTAALFTTGTLTPVKNTNMVKHATIAVEDVRKVRTIPEIAAIV